MSGPEPVPEPVMAQLAGFIDGLSYPELPAQVLEQARRVVLDTVGCIVGGLTATPAQPVLDVFRACAGSPQADVLGAGWRTSCPDAAYVNAYLSDVLDFEDTLVSHPSAAVVPAALAVGQHFHRSGADVLTAIVAGYEVGTRVARALVPSAAMRREVAAEFWWKSIPAVVAAGKLAGVSGGQWADAFGYAAGAAPTPRRGGFEARQLSWMKTNFAGQTQAGVLAALLAAQGFRVHRGMLDGARTLGGLLGSDRWETSELTRALGKDWLIERTGFKVYPCCLYLHPLLQALENLKAGRGVDPARVTGIQARVPRLLVTEFDDRRPASVIDAEFSAPYVLVMSLLGIPPGPAWLCDENLANPRVLSLTARVELIEDRGAAKVRLEFDDGSEVTGEAHIAHGDPDDPMSDVEVGAKFRGLVETHPTGVAADRAHAAFAHLDSWADVNEPIRVLLPIERSCVASTNNLAQEG